MAEGVTGTGTWSLTLLSAARCGPCVLPPPRRRHSRLRSVILLPIHRYKYIVSSTEQQNTHTDACIADMTVTPAHPNTPQPLHRRSHSHPAFTSSSSFHAPKPPQSISQMGSPSQPIGETSIYTLGHLSCPRSPSPVRLARHSPRHRPLPAAALPHPLPPTTNMPRPVCPLTQLRNCLGAKQTYPGSATSGMAIL